MFYFLQGIVDSIEGNQLILNVNNLGFSLTMSSVGDIKVSDEIRLYTYNVVREDENYLIGFLELEEKSLFLELIKVNGIGPKTALSILKSGTPKEIYQNIKSGDLKFFKRIAGLGNKLAKQIILDFEGKDFMFEAKTSKYSDVYDALRKLEFRKADIETVLNQIYDENLSQNELLKKSLQLLGKRYV